MTAAYQLDLAPGSREASPKHLSPVTVVVARARGLGTGSGLVGLVSRRWHTMAASPGQSTRTLDPADTVTASDHRHQNEALVVYRTTHVFTGTFSGVCGGRKVHGRYTTFGPITTVLANCHGGHPGRLEKRARAVGCF